MTEPDDVMVCLELMDFRWYGYLNAKKIIRDEIVRLQEEYATMIDCFHHAHVSRPIVSGDMKGQRTSSCNKCGLDIRHEVHAAAPVKGE